MPAHRSFVELALRRDRAVVIAGLVAVTAAAWAWTLAGAALTAIGAWLWLGAWTGTFFA